MKQVLLFLALLLVATYCYPQSASVLTKANYYRIDDQLTKEEIDISDLDLNKSKLQICIDDRLLSEKKISQTIMPSSDTLSALMSIENSSRRYFRVEENGMLLVGDENKLSKCNYDMPEKWLPCIFLSQDSIYGLFNGIGIYCKRLPYRKFGDYQTKIVGYDQIVFNGDTLNDVSRLLTSRRYVVKYLSQDTLYSNTLPQFTTDSILYNLHSTESFVTEIELRWYAKGYRYPILEHYTLKNERGILQNSYTFFCPIDEQNSMPDTENEAIRLQVSENDNTGSTKSVVSKYSIVQNKEEASLLIKYELSEAANVLFILADTKGIIYKKKQQKSNVGENLMAISYSGLAYGQYVLYIEVNGERLSEKFTNR